MIKRAGLILLAVALLPVSAVLGQTYSESALLFSQYQPATSARFGAIGGAGVSLGGDPGSSLINPAGLGMYNRNDLALSIGYSDLQAGSGYQGTTTNAGRTSLAIPFLGVTFHTPRDKEKLISSSMGISFSKLQDLNRTITYQGRNENNSILDYFINDGYDNDGFALDPQDLYAPTSLAFEAYLIDTLTQNNVTDYGSVLNFGAARQGETIRTTGDVRQWNISYGLNFSDRLFVGGSLGIRSLDYTSRKTYSEADFEYGDPQYDPISGFSLLETLRINGSGFNVNLGVIARPIDGLQVGLSYESPTSMVLSDVYDASLTANWRNFDYYGDGERLNDITARLDEGLVTDYKLRIPGRFTAGGTWIFGKNGFVTAEFETTNFGNAEYVSRTEGVVFNSDNAEIRNLYRKSTTVRGGGEWRTGKMRYRAGFSARPDAYTQVQNGVSTALTNITAGIGYRETKYYVDVAVNYGSTNQSYRPYRVSGADSPLVKSALDRLTVLVTVGLPFRY